MGFDWISCQRASWISLTSRKKDHKQWCQLQVTCTTSNPLKQNRWYHISSTTELKSDPKNISCHLCLQEKAGLDDESLYNRQDFTVTQNLVDKDPGIFLKGIDAPFVRAGRSLNGRLKDPEIKIQTETEKEFLLAAWDISTFSFPEDKNVTEVHRPLDYSLQSWSCCSRITCRRWK